MLVLTINAPDKLHIGDDISFQFSPDPCNEIMKVKRVDIAINAPSNVRILRKELLKDQKDE